MALRHCQPCLPLLWPTDQKQLRGKVTTIIPIIEVWKLVHPGVKWLFQHPRADISSGSPESLSNVWLIHLLASLRGFPSFSRGNTSAVEMSSKPGRKQSDHMVFVTKMLVIFTSLGPMHVADFQSFRRYCSYLCRGQNTDVQTWGVFHFSFTSSFCRESEALTKSCDYVSQVYSVSRNVWTTDL